MDQQVRCIRLPLRGPAGVPHRSCQPLLDPPAALPDRLWILVAPQETPRPCPRHPGGRFSPRHPGFQGDRTNASHRAGRKRFPLASWGARGNGHVSAGGWRERLETPSWQRGLHLPVGKASWRRRFRVFRGQREAEPLQPPDHHELEGGDGILPVVGSQFVAVPGNPGAFDEERRPGASLGAVLCPTRQPAAHRAGNRHSPELG